MESLTLSRFAYSPIGVFGSLLVGGHQLYSVERPWLDNRPVISCIPEGIYTCVPKAFIHGGYPAVEVTGVPGRTAILFHIGNTINDLKGCIALGFGLGSIDGLWAVTASKAAFDHFMSIYGSSPFKLTIKRLPLLAQKELSAETDPSPLHVHTLPASLGSTPRSTERPSSA